MIPVRCFTDNLIWWLSICATIHADAISQGYQIELKERGKGQYNIDRRMGILLVGKVEKTEVDINLDKARKTDALAQQGATFVADGSSIVLARNPQVPMN